MNDPNESTTDQLEQVELAVAAMGCEREGDKCVNHFRRWEFCDWSHCARALAAAVHAEREKYLRVADKLDGLYEYLHASAARDFDRGDAMGGTNLTGQYYATAEAARRIREVAGKVQA